MLPIAIFTPSESGESISIRSDVTPRTSTLKVIGVNVAPTTVRVSSSTPSPINLTTLAAAAVPELSLRPTVTVRVLNLLFKL